LKRTRKSILGGPLYGGHSDLTDAQRVALITKTLKECGQAVTEEAIAKQFFIETRRKWKTAD
jgi:hypothetical protein